ncbi:MAG: hypothetical protein AAGA77_21170, partial [Bacteroidota bacterium]
MKHILTFLIISFLSSTAYAQSKFLAGHFINNDGTKTECLINDKDWRYNPTEIEYKITPDSEIQRIGIDQMSGFEIRGLAKYKKY